MRFTVKRIDIASISSRSRRYFELDTEEFFIRNTVIISEKSIVKNWMRNVRIPSTSPILI